MINDTATETPQAAPAVGARLEPGVKPHSTCGGTAIGYSVEARSDGLQRPMGKQIFDGEWRRVYFESSPIGVPTSPAADPWLAQACLMRYEAAQALRWWFMAESVYGMKTRLVQHRIEYSVREFKDEAMDEQGDACVRAIAARAA